MANIAGEKSLIKLAKDKIYEIILRVSNCFVCQDQSELLELVLNECA